MSTEYNENFVVKDFEIGDNIELHPVTDQWMAGDRFGMVSKLGVKYVHVLMDKSDKTLKFLPKDVGKWNGPGKRSDPADVALVEGRPVADFEKELLAEKDLTILAKFKVPKRPGKARVFSVAGMRISTRSSKPWKRKLAKKLARKQETK